MRCPFAAATAGVMTKSTQQANDEGFQSRYLLIGDRGAAHHKSRSCLSIRARTRIDTSKSVSLTEWLRKAVTSVNGMTTAERLRGRDSNPNFLVQSQASCR